MLSTSRPVVVAVCLSVVAACASDADTQPAASSAPVVQLGAPGETGRVLTDAEVATLDAPEYTDADVAFVHGMIAHHQQALAMTALVDDRAALDDLRLLAERMDVSQVDEIGQMERWLEARGEGLVAGEAHADHAGSMPGMLTDAELAALRAARGAAFDRLFLESMIRHHEGAVVMVETLLTQGLGGQEPEVFQLAQHMDSDQRIEIARMKTMLAELPD
jgi:uncharacterized protein (DUF305 family)